MTQFITAPIAVAYVYDDGSSIENDMATAASYLAACAFTKPTQGPKAENFVKSVRAIQFKAHGRQAPTDLQGVKRERIDGSIKDAMTLIQRHRWPARWMFMKMIGADDDYPLPMGRSSHSITKIAELLCDPEATKDDQAGAILDDGNIGNITGRLWYETLPALAMVMALPSPPDGRVAEWLKQPQWVPNAVEEATTWAHRIAEVVKPKVLFVPQLCAVRV